MISKVSWITFDVHYHCNVVCKTHPCFCYLINNPFELDPSLSLDPVIIFKGLAQYPTNFKLLIEKRTVNKWMKNNDKLLNSDLSLELCLVITYVRDVKCPDEQG